MLKTTSRCWHITQIQFCYAVLDNQIKWHFPSSSIKSTLSIVRCWVKDKKDTSQFNGTVIHRLEKVKIPKPVASAIACISCCISCCWILISSPWCVSCTKSINRAVSRYRLLFTYLRKKNQETGNRKSSVNGWNTSEIQKPSPVKTERTNHTFCWSPLTDCTTDWQNASQTYQMLLWLGCFPFLFFPWQ